MRIKKREDQIRAIFFDLGILADSNFVTDRELALMSALTEVFPERKALLCRWHINNNILQSRGVRFLHKTNFSEFMKA